MGVFPFGAPVLGLGLGLPLRRVKAFVLGAYPSAVHVEWTPPDGLGRAVRALPVDNEPYPFWDGSGMDHFVERWRAEHFDPAWGSVRPSRLNGSSGRALYSRWLEPLGVAVDDYFVTDCLPTSMMSTGVAKVVGDDGVYGQLATQLGLPRVRMADHPSENDIVSESSGQQERIAEQLGASGAAILITLGNAAARVAAQLGGQGGGALAGDTYLEPRELSVGGRSLTWHALVHPAVREPWITRHDEWVARQGAK